MKTFFKMFFVVIGLGVGHILYQLFQVEPQFLVAVERTYFQSAAIMVWIMLET